MNSESSGSRIAWRLTPLPSVLALLLFGVATCSEEGAVRVIRGATMGTTYAIKFGRGLKRSESQRIAAQVETMLVAINQTMSTYDPESELSRFNASDGGRWVALSSELAAVLEIARVVHERSTGAFDVTVGPLVNLWGFGPTSAIDEVPTSEAVSVRLTDTGFDKIEIQSEPHKWRKSHADVYVDLSAVAKGYAVDRLADLLLDRGIADFMVEIGGEIRVSGRRGDGGLWRVGLEKPTVDTAEVARVIEVSDVAMASSGNYRNFRIIDGERYGHAIDPRNGYPVRHDLAAVTILHESAAWADAWATALLVLGPEVGIEVAEQNQLAALFTIGVAASGPRIETRYFRAILDDSE